MPVNEQDQDIEVKDETIEIPDEIEIKIADDEPEQEQDEKPAAEGKEKEQAKADDDEPETQEDDGEEYGRKVRARIQREQRLKQQARREAREAVERAETVARENEELRAKLKQAESAKASGDIDSKIKEVKAKLKQAKVDLDTDAEIDLQHELVALEARRNASAPVEEPAQKPAENARQKEINKLVGEWKRRNAWTKEAQGKNRHVWEEAIDVNRELIEDGYDDSDPEFYTELDKRLADRIDIPKPSTPRTPVEGARPSLPSGGGNKNVVTLTRADLAAMRTFGLDPENKAHLKQWAQGKREAAQ